MIKKKFNPKKTLKKLKLKKKFAKLKKNMSAEDIYNKIIKGVNVNRKDTNRRFKK